MKPLKVKITDLENHIVSGSLETLLEPIRMAQGEMLDTCLHHFGFGEFTESDPEKIMYAYASFPFPTESEWEEEVWILFFSEEAIIVPIRLALSF